MNKMQQKIVDYLILVFSNRHAVIGIVVFGLFFFFSSYGFFTSLGAGLIMVGMDAAIFGNMQRFSAPPKT